MFRLSFLFCLWFLQCPSASPSASPTSRWLRGSLRNNIATMRFSPEGVRICGISPDLGERPGLHYQKYPEISRHAFCKSSIPGTPDAYRWWRMLLWDLQMILNNPAMSIFVASHIGDCGRRSLALQSWYQLLVEVVGVGLDFRSASRTIIRSACQWQSRTDTVSKH